MNGIILSFDLGEFSIMIGFKYVDNDAIVYEKLAKNRPIRKYFSNYAKVSLARQQLLNQFKKKL